MIDKFDSLVWELGKDSPEARDAIIKSLSPAQEEEPAGYYIPTRRYLPLTDSVEDIHLGYTVIEDPEQRERLAQAIKKVDSMTVGQLAKRLGELRAYLIAKEVTGGEVTPLDKTLRDIDISYLALIAFLGA